MSFDLESFRKPIITSEPPLWSQESTTNFCLYQCIVKHFNEIKSALESQQLSTLKKIRIVSRKVAMDCELSPSILSKRRKPEIVQFISTLNEELELIFESEESRKITSGRKPTKHILKEENKILQIENDRLRNLRLAESFSMALENILTEECRTQANTIRQLKAEIERLNMTISNQAKLLQQQVR
ncbi:hypothetical protein [Pseudomonas sp.]|uniref:hypothetical protein n=1 Tax=Pseudomonas sp. TaxID=306 RepID=UPI002487C432|nr:hypothetical protein [Pseudomonas sp.]MDI1330144.1 hypothetical protein [Pseudomonas sp.]